MPGGPAQPESETGVCPPVRPPPAGGVKGVGCYVDQVAFKGQCLGGSVAEADYGDMERYFSGVEGI